MNEDSRRDEVRRRVSKTSEIQVGKGELAESNKIGMGMETCIDVPNWLMLPG
jgi:hypothetical protein